MTSIQSAVAMPPDAQTEQGGEKANTGRRPFILCSRHLEQRREWVNLPEGEQKQREHQRLFRAVAFCPECQELSWSGQPPPPQPEPQPQQQAPDTYSWWRDVMGQP
ncbi:MAG: hypothetical protein GX774_00125 [Armatimonadetes bacterium]|nr:hypothetical protein [Armatimonadota bacterium]